MRILSLLLSLVLAAPAMAQPAYQPGPGPVPAGASTVTATGGNTSTPLATRFSRTLNVVDDFGAKCDGSTNDTAVIQAALNNGAGKARIYVPYAGTSCMTTSLTVPSNIHLTIDGQLQLIAATNTNVLSLANNANNVVIDGSGTIDGNKSAQTADGTAGIGNVGVSGASNVWVSGITITNVRNWPVNFFNTSNVWLSRVTMTNSGNSPEFAAGSSNCWANQIYVSGIGDYGFAFYGGISNCGISNSIIVGSLAGGIVVLNDSGQTAPSNNITISNNTVYNSTASGVTVLTNNGLTGINKNIVISNNVLHHNNKGNLGGYGGVYLYNSYYVSVTGNVISYDGNGASSSVGISNPPSSYYTTISGNTIVNEGQGGNLGVGIALGGPFASVTNNSMNDDQATKTMAFLLNGAVGTASQVANNILGYSIGAPNNLTYNANTAYVQSQNTAGQQHLSQTFADNAFGVAQTTVASLPTCNTGLKGSLYGVTDATAPTYNGALTGGGTVAIPAYCTGTAWVAH